MKLLGFLLPFFIFQVSWANGDWFYKGNGGFVLNCSDKKLQTFDLFEMTERYQLTEDNRSSTDLDQQVEYLLQKLEVLSPLRAKIYREWYISFQKEAFFASDMWLAPLADLGQAFYPKNCKLELAVFQRNPSVESPHRYIINKALWEQLDVKNQAALVLHELIYREASGKETQHQTSEASRYLNALLNSQEFHSQTLQSFLQMLQRLRFSFAEAYGFKISLGSYHPEAQGWEVHPLVFHPKGSLESASFQGIQKELIPHLPPRIVDTCGLNNSTLKRGILRFNLKHQIEDVSVMMDRGTMCFDKLENESFIGPNQITSLMTNPDGSYYTTVLFADHQTLVMGNYRLQVKGSGKALGALLSFSKADALQAIHFMGKVCRASAANALVITPASERESVRTRFSLESIDLSYPYIPICL